MANILKSIRSQFSPVEVIPPGTYHYLSPQDDPRNYRLHLRVEPDGNGVLIINASTILHLNQTATEYAYYLVNISIFGKIKGPIIAIILFGFWMELSMGIMLYGAKLTYLFDQKKNDKIKRDSKDNPGETAG